MKDKTIRLLLPIILFFSIPLLSFSQTDTLLEWLKPFMGSWYSDDPNFFQDNLTGAQSIGFKLDWGHQQQKSIRFYEGIPGGDLDKRILELMVVPNPHTGQVEFLGYQYRNDFLFKGRFEPLMPGPGFIRIYDVFYPPGTKFKYKSDERKGMKSYRDICRLIESDTLECTTEQLDFGQWKPWGKGEPYRMLRKKVRIEIPGEYKELAFLIGIWESKMGDNAGRMNFSWGENQRNIHFSNQYRPGKDKAWVKENEGLITYHGVKNQLMFVTSYLKKGSHLVAQGNYKTNEEGAIIRQFICHYKAGDLLPWSDGQVAPRGGKSIEFKQIWTPINDDTFSGDFFWKKNGKWVHPIKKYDEKGFKEIWKRLK